MEISDNPIGELLCFVLFMSIPVVIGLLIFKVRGKSKEDSS